VRKVQALAAQRGDEIQLQAAQLGLGRQQGQGAPARAGGGWVLAGGANRRTHTPVPPLLSTQRRTPNKSEAQHIAAQV
jgi:hypothetical protein